MRLSGKFIFACALVSTFLATITAAVDYDISSLKKDATNDVFIAGGYTMTVKLGERDKIWNLITGQNIKPITVTTTNITTSGTALKNTDSLKMKFDDGATLTFSIAAGTAVGENAVTVTYVKGTGTAPDSHTLDLAKISFATPDSIKVPLAGTITDFMTEIGIVDGDKTIVSDAITNKDVCSFDGTHAIKKKNAAGTEEVVTAVYHRCYKVTDTNMLLCVNWRSTTDVNVSVRPAPPLTLAGKIIEHGTGPAIVVLLGMLGAWLSALAFSMIDPEGYQAGKEASSLFEGIKSVLPDAEGYGGEGGLYGDEDAGEIYKVDPSTGRHIRVRKAGSAVGGDDLEGPTEEKTDASAFTVLAALLAVPFLL